MLLQVVVEILLEIVFGILLEIAVSLYRIIFDRSNWGILAAIVGYCLVGGLTGGASLYIWPTRVFPRGTAPGLSLALAPLCVGWALATWGDARRSRGHVTSSLATFSGGAGFAFGAALVRFIGVR